MEKTVNWREKNMKKKNQAKRKKKMIAWKEKTEKERKRIRGK